MHTQLKVRYARNHSWSGKRDLIVNVTIFVVILPLIKDKQALKWLAISEFAALATKQ